MTHRVTVKTLKHDVVHLDLPHDCTVDECKEHLRAHRPDWRGEQQLRLMSNGKQLTAGTLAAAGVFEYVEAAADRFIVALLTPTKPAATPAKAVVLPTLPVTAPSRKRSGGNESFLVACAQRLRDTAVSAEAKGRRQWASAGPTAPPPPPAPAEWLIAAPTPSEAAEAAAQAAEAAREAATHAAALEVVQTAEALAQLMAMGFGEAEAARALRAARGSVAAAVDALTGGTPAATAPPPPSAAVAGLRGLGREARAASLAGDVTGDARTMAMLRRMPEVQEVLRMPRCAGIEERPDDLTRLVQRVLLNPELQQAMKERRVTPAMLDAALDGPAPGAGLNPNLNPTRADRLVAMAHAHAAQRGAAGGGGGGGGSGAAANVLEQQLSAADEAAMARLQELGFGRGVALEAYLACERDETLAANLLFDS